MKTLYYPAYNELLLKELPEPAIAEDEVLVKVSACGICGSELESFKTKSPRRFPPLIMGHEFCGIVERTGASVTGWKQGDTAVSNSVVSCGECERCKEGKSNLCASRQIFGMHRNGAFGAYVNVPASSLIAMPAGTDSRQACLTEPLANGVHLVRLTSHLDIKNVLVIGAGPIGLAALQAFNVLREARVIVSDIRPERLAVAKSIGAGDVINPAEEDIFNVLPQMFDEGTVDLVIDAVGSAQTNHIGLEITKPGGTLLIIGLHNNSKSLFSYDIVLSEKTVMGSYAATQQDMEDALVLIAQQKVDMASWVHYYSLEQGKEAFMDMLEARGNHIKSVIVFE